MENAENYKRWYDKDPSVSLAVSFLRNANHESQILVADFLMEQFQILQITPAKSQFKIVNLFKRRWYDFDRKLQDALECLRIAPSEIQKKLAVDVINYLYKLDNQVSKDAANCQQKI